MYSLGTPASDLADCIAQYWFVSCQPGQTFHLSVDVYVDGQADLVVNLGPPYERHHGDGSVEVVTGSSIDAQRTRPLTIRQEGEVHVCGARFQVGGLAAFTGMSMHTLSDRVVRLDTVFGAAGSHLMSAVRNVWPDTNAAASALDEFFRSQRRTDQSRTRFNQLLDQVNRSLPGNVSVAAIASATGLSIRSVQRLFVRHLGLRPAFYLRVARFQGALKQMMDDPRCDLARLTQDAGYYDQSHLIREFHELAGAVPKRFRGYMPEAGRDFAPNVVRYREPEAPA